MMLRKLQTLWLRLQAQWALSQARTTTECALRRASIAKVLVVCHGNIYRSALVGEYLRQRLPEQFETQSAGFHPVGQRPAPQQHIDMCAAVGIDLGPHRSTVLTLQQSAWADIIVLMDRRNWVALRRLGADPSRFVWLGALVPGPVEIADPYGLAESKAQVIVDRLLVCSKQLVERLLSRDAR